MKPDKAESAVNIYEKDFFANLPCGVMRPGGIMLTRRLAEYCGFDRNTRLVDIGCGAGVTVEFLENTFGANIIGVDMSEKLLQIGRDRAPHLQLIKASGEELPFTDSSLDAAVVECSLSVMPDAGKVLAEIRRVTVAGGKLAITDVYHTGDEALAEAGGAQPAESSGLMTKAELAKLLADNGFNIVLWEDHPTLLMDFVAWFIMEHGSAEELRQCFLTGHKIQNNDSASLRKLGYYLLVAEKL